MTARSRLAARQRAVLDDLLAGRVPDGFDPAGVRLASRVLLRKRSDAAERVLPALAELPGWPAAYHDWAAGHPQQGCAHDDVRAFLGEHPGDRRLVEVYDGRRRAAWGQGPGGRELVVGLGTRVWRLGRRTHRTGRREQADG